ncbi:MAG: hypothetical protein V3V95_08315, partial [Thermodesulfobacteriota bacterium]
MKNPNTAVMRDEGTHRGFRVLSPANSYFPELIQYLSFNNYYAELVILEMIEKAQSRAGFI